MEEEKYMRRCIQLAQNGLCNAAPNPMVGAVIVCDGKIIGEGYHVRCGEAHAEVNAIRSVKDTSLLKRSTIYVSLEPCSHYGKTPPCADLIIEKQIPRIVIGCRDPFSKVAGRGIQKLKDAGREVIVGVLETECRQLIRRFITFHTLRRPYITLKWAESSDRYIDYSRTDGKPVILSSPLTSMLVHKKRAEHSAIMHIDLDREARRLEKERRGQFPELLTCIYRVTNPVVFGRSLMQINARAITGAVISRHKHGEQISIPTAHTVLRENDYIQAVGSDEALNQLATLVGEREEGELPLSHTQEIESLLLTKKDMINKQLGDLNLMKNFGCTVTRVRRSGIDLAPSPDLALKFGDKLTVVGEKEGLKGLARLLGNNAKKLSDTDFFPIAMGIVLGVLFGKLNISFPGGLSFSPGLTGGILIVALFLSAIGKTGPVIWSMSGPANQLLRQLGLLLFLAEVGTSAGKNLVATFQESGWLLFGVGAAITLVPMLIAVIVGRMVFKISILDLLGTITGGMTSTPGLAAADSMTDSNIPSVAYATVYPIAMVFLILSIQIIATVI